MRSEFKQASLDDAVEKILFLSTNDKKTIKKSIQEKGFFYVKYFQYNVVLQRTKRKYTIEIEPVFYGVTSFDVKDFYNMICKNTKI